MILCINAFPFSLLSELPELQSDHTINIVTAVAGNNDDRHVGARSDLSQQIQAILLTEPKIEDHQIDFGAAKVLNHVLAT